MKMAHSGFLLLIMFSISGLTGCAFTVKNTDGLNLAYKDIDLASSYASELKSMKNVLENRRATVVDLYREAKSELNGYLQKAITDASDYEVNNPKEEYLATQGTARVHAFEKEVKKLRRVHLKTMSAPAWTPVAEAAIRTIWDLNQKAREEGRKRFEETVIKYMMKNYEEIPVIQGAGK